MADASAGVETRGAGECDDDQPASVVAPAWAIGAEAAITLARTSDELGGAGRSVAASVAAAGSSAGRPERTQSSHEFWQASMCW